ncbi:hypothetical protein GCM10025883_26660 [Mobilicoccus caccae]|uniref:Biotin carboxylation domain-containing protein n=1 Tax=Mobilicoccus caccae TaxID=1859295 RepID=A0ABQ6IU81_9MICO|nr:hypothetical protein GCM10025883_26660 [Mobilicoccus caccae]
MNVVDSPVVVVANRGEIAVRVLRASRDEGLRAVLLAEAGDEVTRARRIADDVVTLERGVSSIYLDAPRLVAAAREVSSDRVLLHPGYGYLSEDPALPRACAEAGVEFVGPSPEALALLGHKGATRELADAVGAPTLRGTGVDPDAEQVCGLIAEVSGPVVLKAASGEAAAPSVSCGRQPESTRRWPPSAARPNASGGRWRCSRRSTSSTLATSRSRSRATATEPR